MNNSGEIYKVHTDGNREKGEVFVILWDLKPDFRSICQEVPDIFSYCF